jgi:WD40-like Beta Propeller Repeat
MRIALAALAVGLVAVVGGGVTANATPNEVSPTITQLAWSPNGRWLAFAEDDYRAGSVSISVVRLDRAVQRRVAASRLGYGSLYLGAWSPDSKQVAFVDEPGPGAFTTWIASANGGRLRPFEGWFQDWSPDSRSFVVARQLGPYAIGLYVIDSRTGAVRFLAQGSGADWSPAGTRIAFTAVIRLGRCFGSESRIFSVNTDGSDRRQLGGDGTPWSRQYIVGWAPDSSRLAYYESYPYCDIPPTRGTFMVPADGSRQETEIGHGAYSVAWSPGGRRFAVREWEDRGLRIVAPDGVTLATITDATGDFGWGPKGGSVVFSTERGSRGGIYAARADGTGHPRSLGYGTYPTWSRLAWIAFAARGWCAGSTERVYVVRPNGKRLHVLSRCRPTR